MIKKAGPNDCPIVSTLALELWPHHSIKELNVEFKEYLQSNEKVIFLYQEKETPIAFAYCSLRHDYVEGTISSPVAYLEGIYVKENNRLKGIAKELLLECEKWAKKKDCKEIASDCELQNKTSFEFHLKTGFEEANRIICFTKKI